MKYPREKPSRSQMLADNPGEENSKIMALAWLVNISNQNGKRL